MGRNGLFLFTTILFLLVVATTTQITDLSTDKSSLNALKSYVTSDPKKILTDEWSDSTFICNWTGVTCGGGNNNTLRVVGLNLSFSGLVGTVPPHLGNLSSLVNLSLQQNSFHGVLPRELSRLRSLEILSFGFNDLAGDIPSWLWTLPKLKGLYLPNNHFSGLITPTTVPNSASLEVIELQDNNLSGRVPWALFNDMSNLRVVAISTNKYKDTVPENICQHFPMIEEIYFDENQLSGPIPSKLWQCKELRILSLGSNNFVGEIPKSISNWTMLTQLYLYNNNLTVSEQAGFGFNPTLSQ